MLYIYYYLLATTLCRDSWGPQKYTSHSTAESIHWINKNFAWCSYLCIAEISIFTYAANITIGWNKKVHGIKLLPMNENSEIFLKVKIWLIVLVVLL